MKTLNKLFVRLPCLALVALCLAFGSPVRTEVSRQSGLARTLGWWGGTRASGMSTTVPVLLFVTVAAVRVDAAKLKSLSYHQKPPKVKVEGWHGSVDQRSHLAHPTG